MRIGLLTGQVGTSRRYPGGAWRCPQMVENRLLGMAEKQLHICVDWSLPLDRQVAASKQAVALRPDNAPLAPPAERGIAAFHISMALATGRKWPIGYELRVRFLDGEDWQHEVVERFAREWCDYANVLFSFGSADNDAEIRVSFRSGQGSKSLIGTDVSLWPKDEATMNFGWLDTDLDVPNRSSVILHEFGHALACLHEHQSPAAGIKWNKEAVYAYYAKQGWSRQQVDEAIFETYDRNKTKFSAFDPASIMIYPIPAALTLDGWSVAENTELSDGDKAFIGRSYPAAIERVELSIDQAPVRANLGHAEEEDQFSFTVEENGFYIVETTGSTNVSLALYGPDAEGRLVASDDDAGRQGYNARLRTVLMAGEYLIRIRHRAEGTGEYTLAVRRDP